MCGVRESHKIVLTRDWAVVESIEERDNVQRLTDKLVRIKSIFGKRKDYKSVKMYVAL